MNFKQLESITLSIVGLIKYLDDNIINDFIN
jgi:hypothetical protein